MIFFLKFSAMFSIPNVDVEPIEEVHFVEPPLERIGEAIELVNRCHYYLYVYLLYVIFLVIIISLFFNYKMFEQS